MSAPGTEKLQKEMLSHKMADVLRAIINSCVHPDKAMRAVMVDLAPIRAVLNEYNQFYPPAPPPQTQNQFNNTDNSSDILVFES